MAAAMTDQELELREFLAFGLSALSGPEGV
jgi:hypothetical protein